MHSWIGVAINCMALTKEKKKEIVGKVAEVLKVAKSLVFVNFHGLTTAKVTKLRRALSEGNVGYLVAKKTLAKIAFTEAKFEGKVPELSGEFAVAYGTDLVAPAREVYKFQKEFKEGFSIVGGVFEGRFMNKAEMTEIGSIPPMEVLYSQLVNLINSPIQGLTIALKGIADSKHVG